MNHPEDDGRISWPDELISIGESIGRAIVEGRNTRALVIFVLLLQLAQTAALLWWVFR